MLARLVIKVCNQIRQLSEKTNTTLYIYICIYDGKNINE